MSQTIAAFHRCPRCGNENPADSFACNFCGFRLRIERIEKLSLFRRIEAEWVEPYKWYLKILLLFTSANKAFWDINHKRSMAPGWLIWLFSSVLYGVLGIALFSRFNFTMFGRWSITRFVFTLSFFLTFFMFGLLSQLILFWILIWLFTKGANYAVGFSERLETRFGGLKDTKEKYKESEMSPFSIYKGGTMLELEASYKFRMMLCAFAPFLLTNTLKIVIALITFPTVDVPSLNPMDIGNILLQMFSSRSWAIFDIIDALTIAIWVPILMTLAIRELSNSSTTRVLIPNLIIGIIIAILFYILRPTLLG
ncbi:MAG: hypothetical protein ACFFEN_05795 [Candidatus Thorarchaeota archaeon]